MSKSSLARIFLLLLTALSIQPFLQPTPASTNPVEVAVMDEEGQPVSALIDGDRIRLRAKPLESVVQDTKVMFFLNGIENSIAGCVIPRGKQVCETELFSTLGWYWDPGGQARPSREVFARGDGEETFAPASTVVRVSPRPVVMVHGFSSSWEAWTNYIGPGGFLAGVGIQGYAAGDGQVPGVMNTGSLSSPTGKTNTIAENAAVLGEYITAVRKATGAQKVDLLAHSMGGLISRYYIDRLMPAGEVAQLIMLGSPMSGTGCANLPAALGFYLPAALEIQPSYVAGIFNSQITHRKGVAFHALAGIPIQDTIQSPCTPVPSDLAVSLASVAAIPLSLTRMPVLHTELNTSEQVFREYVLPLLQTPAGGFAPLQPDPPLPTQDSKALQFTRMYTGHLDPGEARELVIQIDPGISVASFSMYDSSRSLDVVVRGASGNVITLDPVANGLVKVEDPSTLFYLGYAFKNPKPGAWKITLVTTGQTPAGGAEYALTALFTGGAELQVQVSSLLPRQNEQVALNAQLSLGGQTLAIGQAEAQVRMPDGSQETVPFSLSSSGAQGVWIPRMPGLNYLQVKVAGQDPGDLPVERTAFLVIETQPSPGLPVATWLLMGGCLLAIFGFALVLGLLFRSRRRRLDQNGT